MSDKPLFSVLIANYNNGKYINTAIESVISQTYENWEIIIIDDFSLDSSKDVLDYYSKNKKIKISYNNKNRGCGFTKNRCVNEAKGKLAGFLDPDDKLEKEAIEVMVGSHDEYPSASLIYSNFYKCDSKLNIISKSESPISIPKNSNYLELPCGRISHFATFKLLSYYKTEQINPNYKRAVDQDLYLKLEEVGDTVFIDIPLYFYRDNLNGISLHNNKLKAYSWSLVARIDACNRRNILVEDVLPNVIESETSIKLFYENSRDYKLGKVLLKPIRYFKTILGFYKK